MSLPKYGEYKSSGVEWLGQVPAHWDTPRLKTLLRETDERAGGDDAELLGLSKSLGVVRRAELDQGAAASDDYAKYKLVHPEQLVMNKMQAWNGVFGLSANFGMVSPDYATFQFVRPDLGAYLTALFRTDVMAGVFFTRCRGMGIAFLRLNAGDFLDIKVPLPPQNEVEAIATFLKRETAKIDALITEQEKLIALLAEKRQATISHAVTRGIYPDAPMKDSGVAWLGEVPAHWKVTQLRYVASVARGASPRPAGDPVFFADDSEGGVNRPWVTVAEVTKDDGIYLTEVNEFLTPLGVMRSQTFRTGTLVFTNSGATLGVPKILGIDCCANDGIVAFNNLSAEIDIRFLYFFLLTTTERLRTEMKQGGGQPNLNTGIVKDISFAVPPGEQQTEIVDFVLERLLKLEMLSAEAAAATTLLKERRAALIAAAVTGQIKVFAD